jgi:hypothetical protein
MTTSNSIRGESNNAWLWHGCEQRMFFGFHRISIDVEGS